jgi:tripeptide aminopeptidase
MKQSYSYSVLDRFLKYVQVDTQSDPHSSSFPSTAKQFDLANILVSELKEMGLTEVELDPYGYVYATIPSNTTKTVPVLCLCAHMDTAPDCSGTDVKPIVHSKWDGSDIVLPDDPTQIIRVEEHPYLAQKVGDDLVTASGLTLLGADNKAGVAEIMDAAQYLLQHPEIKHGKIRILFTPDEEVGRGVQHVDMKKLGADFGYTLDGGELGSIEDETFSADAAKIIIDGISTHPGTAKGKMISAIKVASAIVDELPKEILSPETTSDRQGFIHPVHISGTVEKATIEFIIRDFTTPELEGHAFYLQKLMERVVKQFPGAQAQLQITPQYRNMKEVLDQHPQVVANAAEAMRQVGIEPQHLIIRGGTDGSRLSFMGLPCPNLFTGEMALHSKHEYVSVQDMQRAVDTIVSLVQVWESKAS